MSNDRPPVTKLPSPVLWPKRALAYGATAVLGLLALVWLADGVPALPDVAWLRERQDELLHWQQQYPRGFGLGLFLLFVLLATLALPGCSVLALAAGCCYGLWVGTLVVALASAVGATLSFLASRHFLRDAVHARWGHRLEPIHRGLQRDGSYYLFSLRLAPVIPYGVLNPLMGLSQMPMRQFFIVSLLGMLAGSAAYVYAGTQLGHVQDAQDLVSMPVLASLTLLAALPWALRTLVRRWRAPLAVPSILS